MAIALVAEPDFLILDEPFVGLDPIGVQKLIDILKKWSNERQISMLISSHQLGELEALCERYVYIEAGHLADAFDGATCPSLLVYLNETKNLEVIQALLSDDVSLEGHVLDISTKIATEEINEIFKTLGNHALIEKIEVKENHLKEIFTKGQ